MTILTSTEVGTDEGRYCPKCNGDWRSTEISRDALFKGYYGHEPPCTKKRSWDDGYDENAPCDCPPRYYSHLVGVELSYDDPNHYDGVSLWMCPYCGTRWDRWTMLEKPTYLPDTEAP